MKEWDEWLAEGDCAGEPATGQEYEWQTRSRMALQIRPGDRFYVVAHGKLRGWAPVVRVEKWRTFDGSWCFAIVRAGKAVACTLPYPVPGFRGLRKRWWGRYEEMQFPGLAGSVKTMLFSSRAVGILIPTGNGQDGVGFPAAMSRASMEHSTQNPGGTRTWPDPSGRDTGRDRAAAEPGNPEPGSGNFDAPYRSAQADP